MHPQIRRQTWQLALSVDDSEPITALTEDGRNRDLMDMTGGSGGLVWLSGIYLEMGATSPHSPARFRYAAPLCLD